MGKCFKLILKESDPKGFYRGMSTPLLLATPVSALAFMGNTWAKATILPTSGYSQKSCYFEKLCDL